MPDFICVGAQKAATSSFYNMIRKHPDIFMPEKKELHYFDRDEYQHNDYDMYMSYFEGSEKYKLRGEVTPSYLYFEEVPERIFDLLGADVKIIIMLRNPIDRALSQYKMTCRLENSRGDSELLTFEQAFYVERERITIDTHHRREYSYFDRGLYSKQVERYYKLFSNVKVILFEDFVKNSQETMGEIYAFLGIEDCKVELAKSNVDYGTGYKYPKLTKIRKNIASIVKKITFLKDNKVLEELNKKFPIATVDDKEKYRISGSFGGVLQKYFYEDICVLEKIIDRDLSEWKK